MINFLDSLSLHHGIFFFHIPLFINRERFQFRISLFTNHDSTFQSSTANSTGSIYRISNQRKLRFVISDYSHHTRPCMNSYLNFQFSLVFIVIWFLLDDIHELNCQVKSSFYGVFVSNMFGKFFFSHTSSTSCYVSVTHCLYFLNTDFIAENIEILENYIKEIHNVILVVF